MIHKILIKKVAEFMYKIIQRLTMCRAILKNWKQRDDDTCPVCHNKETVKHIYFDCECVNNMWKSIGNALSIDLTWKKNTIWL